MTNPRGEELLDWCHQALHAAYSPVEDLRESAAQELIVMWNGMPQVG